MRRICAVVALLLAVSFVAAEDKKAGLTPEMMAGTYTYVSTKKAGEDAPKERLEGEVVISKETFTMPAGPDMKFVIAYKLDATKKPVTVDMDIKDGPVKEGKALGIIEMKGDELTLCYGIQGTRPAKFESTKDGGEFLVKMKKKKK